MAITTERANKGNQFFWRRRTPMTKKETPPTKKTNRIIDITKILEARNPTVNQLGMKAMQSLTPEEADAATAFIFNMVLTNVEIGLGTINTDDDPEIEKYIEELTDEDMIFYEKINDIYKKSVRNCYFCRNDIDPNAEFITRETYICLTCKRKLGNFIESLGVPRDKIFKLQNPPKNPSKPPKNQS